MNTYFTRFVGILFFISILNGCGAAKVKVHKSPLFSTYPLSVAILPFSIEKDAEFVEPGTEKTLREVFYNYFCYLSFSDQPLEETDRILKINGLKKINFLDPIPLKKLQSLLGVDAVIKGQLLNSNNFTAGIYAETWIKAKMQMIDLKTGDTLWGFTHEEIDQSSIVTPTVVDIVRQQMANSDSEKAYYKLAERFASKVVRKIPDPSKIAQRRVNQPTISGIYANIETSRKLQTGDIIEVTLTGSPGLLGSFDIGSWKSSLPLKESQPGIYTGSYSILPKDNFHNVLLIGRLKNKKGLVSKKALPGAMLSTIKLPIQKGKLKLPNNVNKFEN